MLFKQRRKIIEKYHLFESKRKHLCTNRDDIMHNVNVLNEEVNRRTNLNEKMLEQKTMERKS
jgi:hypothetical protein